MVLRTSMFHLSTMRTRLLSFRLLTAFFAFLLSCADYAGPPYLTDDPETVEYQHWEFYISTIQDHNFNGLTPTSGWSGTLPHSELNYGIISDVQLHVQVEEAYNKVPGQPMQYGYGETELGVKYRFIHETDYFPQVALYPFLELPTGNEMRELGSDKAQVFLPLWFQKNLGKDWQTFGGGGYWFNPGPGNRDWWYTGWAIQRKMTEKLNVGVEVFHEGPQMQGQSASTGANFGAVLDITENYHLLASAGHTLQGGFLAYFGIQFTWGPEAPKKIDKPEK